MATLSFFSGARKPERSSENQNTVFNQYIAARREWDERYGELITRARNWRTIAMMCCLIALVATAGMVWFASRSHVVPFVVAVDNLGRPVASGIAEQASVADGRLKRATILEWIENLRMVTSDGVAQRRAIDRVYAHIASTSQAQASVSEFYRSDQPFTKAQSQTVGIEVKSVLATSDRTFEVDWVETTRDLYGAVKGTDHWKASLTIATNPPKDERMARVNPLGIYVTQANWAKVL